MSVYGSFVYLKTELDIAIPTKKKSQSSWNKGEGIFKSINTKLCANQRVIIDQTGQSEIDVVIKLLPRKEKLLKPFWNRCHLSTRGLEKSMLPHNPSFKKKTTCRSDCTVFPLQETNLSCFPGYIQKRM